MGNEKIEKIIRPEVFVATTLDDISRKLSTLIVDIETTKNLNSKILESNNRLLDNNSKLIESTNKIERLNSLIEQTDSKILKEMVDERDEGEYLRRTDTATTAFTIIDVVGILGFPVKGWEIHNDGNNTILFAHNLMPTAMNMDIDVNNTRFSPLLGGDNIAFRFNRRTIRNIYIRTETGTSDYRLWLVW